ncbi:hypothetical protein [Paenibacillus phytorum]|uniref:hypothetical protein n=1 Tax=Paenibacillus phytorum TaxID=2654977 RepID=UPI001FE620C8|nr:hypothetical protein [Paenibacillus phytorum]
MHRAKVLQNNAKRQISVIQQENVIFHGTIREDISYHQPEFGYHHLEWGIEGRVRVTQRIIKAPQGLAASPFNQSVLKLKGLTVIESCTNTVGKQGTMFLEDYLLMFVLNGTYTVIRCTLFISMKWYCCKNPLSLSMKNQANLIRLTY